MIVTNHILIKQIIFEVKKNPLRDLLAYKSFLLEGAMFQKLKNIDLEVSITAS